MDSLKFVWISGGTRSLGTCLGWAVACCSLFAGIAACSSESGDPSSDVVAVGGASPQNEFAVSADQARAANGGRLGASIVAYGGQAMPSPQANPPAGLTRTDDAAQLRRAEDSNQAPTFKSFGKVLD